ncbi:GlxA family transcriptional regulator [Pseudomonas sp. SDO5271_S396]
MHITLLLADQCSAASATLALEMLSAANLFADSPPFEITVASLDGQAVNAWGGQRLQVNTALAQVGRTDLVLVPGFLFTLKEALPAFAAYGPWLREQHARGTVLASMCTATFLLAETGVLQGLRATTHWAFAEWFRRRYPGVNLDDGQILCEENRVITCGGASAAMDLMLHLIRRFGSPELAQTCGKYLLIDNVRTEQSVYAMWSLPKSHGDGDILKVQHWLEQHFAKSLVIDDVAQRFGFGARNFKRRFKDATGLTPIAYLQTLRLERAKQMLESSRMTLESITYAVGYEDSNSFRRLFQQRVGMLPAAYRKKFLVTTD